MMSDSEIFDISDSLFSIQQEDVAHTIQGIPLVSIPEDSFEMGSTLMQNQDKYNYYDSY